VEGPEEIEPVRDDTPDGIPEDGLCRDWLDKAALFGSEELTP